MTAYRSSEDRYFPSLNILFGEVFPELANEISTRLKMLGRIDLSDQIYNLLLIQQLLRGNEKYFSFMAYTVPRMSTAERQEAKLVWSERISLELDNGSVDVDTNDFGRVNWLNFRTMPDLFVELDRILRSEVPIVDQPESQAI